jgi:hypothetical protein
MQHLSERRQRDAFTRTTKHVIAAPRRGHPMSDSVMAAEVQLYRC